MLKTILQLCTSTTIAYTASDIFGPAGDHLGLRDRWEAYCASNGIKSIIGNYKDKRFNSLFQTCAEVFFHRDNFLEVIRTAPNPNQKILSVEADLQSETVNTMLRAFATVYVKITGLYGWLVTSGKSSYLELHSHVHSLENFLEECAEDPGILHKDNTWINAKIFLCPTLTNFKLNYQILCHLINVKCTITF
ncbi:Piwi-like protein 1 [Mactra antiquata]